MKRLLALILRLIAAAAQTATLAAASPAIQQTLPAAGSTVETLTFINVTFDTSVTGVDAGDLLINGTAAASLLTVSDREYQFNFTQPPTGAVSVAWAAGHGIADTASNSFAGGSWAYTLNPDAFRPVVIVSEFMADNAHGIQDEDGSRSDWIELFNPGPLDANLAGWFLTDDAAKPAKWRFPAVSLGVNKYLLVWASSKDRTNPAAPLHTSFKLSKGGQYLGLYDSRTNVASEFAPAYPAQTSDVSYGRDSVDFGLVGFFTTPTPGAQNSTRGTGFAAEPVFSLGSGVYTNTTVTLTITNAGGGTIRFTLDGSVPTTNSTVYSSALTFGTNATIRARVFQTGLWPSPVVARNYVFLDSTARDFNSNLPMLILNTAGRAIQANIAPGAARVAGSLVLINTNATGRCSLRDTPDFQGLAGFEIFGQTSSGFVKKQYNVELQDELGNDLAIPLLGMPAEADWKLRNPYSDKCMMNDFLGYEVFEKMGHYSCRRRFVEVFVASTGGRLTYPRDYSGILVLFEKIERGKDRVDIAELTSSMTNEPNISGGYIFKKDKDSTGDLNFTNAAWGGFTGQALKIHEPKARDITPTQLAWLTNYLYQFERSLYAANWLTATGTNHYSYYIDTDSFADFHWIVEFTKQIDGYRLSNYLQKDRNGKVKMEPIWDWNLSFGNANYADGGHVSAWYYPLISENQHIWLRRLITGTTSATSTAGDPDFNQKIADRWSLLRTNVLNGTNLNARIDEIAAALSEAAGRDFAKFPRLYPTASVSTGGEALGYVWPNPNGAAGGWDVDYVHPTNYDGIIAEMKKWVLGRYLWVDSQFAAVPAFSRADGPVAPGSALNLTGPAGGTIYYTLNGTDPRLPGGGIAPGAFSGTSPLTVPINSNVCVVARARTASSWNSTWSGPVTTVLYTALPALRVTELMFSPEPPPSGSPYNNDDFEFVELKNTGTNTLSLVGFRFTNGIDFTFTATNWITSLAAGGRVLVVKNFAAFASRYPSVTNRVAGEYNGNLNNGGEELYLEGPMREPVLDFTYSDAWDPVTDGTGFSLVVVDDTAPPSAWTNAANWRASTYELGSPGLADPAPSAISPVLVSEVLSRPVVPALDAIELFNPNTNAVDLSGWYLTDDANFPKKYRLPDGTVIVAGGYLVFDESVFNSLGSPTAFAFDAGGDHAYLFSGNPTNGLLTGYSDGVSFDGAALGVSFGRYLDSLGQSQFVAQTATTLGTNNAGPLVGPVVISEIMFHPPDLGTNDNIRDEFIELHNLTAAPMPLFDTNHSTNTWRLAKAVSYDFPTNTFLAPNGYALVVSFDPVADTNALAGFKARYGALAGVPLFGHYSGHLGNVSEAIQLQQPITPDYAFQSELWVLADEIHYASLPPWPCGTDGTGSSLQRQRPAEFGNDPINWAAAAPTPGSASTIVPPGLPAIAGPPVARTVADGSSASFSVTACGSQLSYQWVCNTTNLPLATNATLVLPNVQAGQAGNYAVAICNAAGCVTSAPVALTVLQRPVFTLQPLGQTVPPGSNATLRVTLTGDAPIAVQWLFNGANLPNATNLSLALTNVQTAQAGTYQVRATNIAGSTLSDAVLIIVPVPIAITAQPQSQGTWPYSNVTFTVTLTGSQPLGYQWRWFGTNLPNATNATLLKTGLLPSDAGSYVVVITNTVSAVTSAPALLTLATNPLILTQPASRSAALGSNAAFTVLAFSSTPLRFQWFFNNTNSLAGATNDTYSLANVQATNYGSYVVRVSDNFGFTNSDAALLAEKLKPTITQQPWPTNNAILLGQPLTYFATAIGPMPLSFRWRRGGATLTNSIQYETNSSFSIPTGPFPKLAAPYTNLSAGFTNAGNYDVVVTNIAGNAPASTRSYLTVMEPLTNQVAWPGSNVTFTFMACSSWSNSVSGGSGLRYQWFFNETNLLLSMTNATNMTLTLTNITLNLTNVQAAQEGAYKAVLTTSNGLSASQSATLTLLRPPLVTAPPVSQTVFTGSNVVFAVTASGTAPLYYQWWFNQTNLLPDATGPSLLLTNVIVLQTGGYSVVVSNQLGSATSPVAQLTVLIPAAPEAKEVTVRPDLGGLVQITFLGRAGQSYSVLWSEDLSSGQWQVLANFEPPATDRLLTAQDGTAAGRPQRFYRIVTPMQE